MQKQDGSAGDKWTDILSRGRRQVDWKFSKDTQKKLSAIVYYIKTPDSECGAVDVYLARHNTGDGTIVDSGTRAHCSSVRTDFTKIDKRSKSTT